MLKREREVFSTGFIGYPLSLSKARAMNNAIIRESLITINKL